MVPYGEREHPNKFVETTNAPVFVGPQQNLSVRLRAELELISQFISQFLVIIDFAVGGNPNRLVVVGHRLMPGSGKVDDGESLVAYVKDRTISNLNKFLTAVIRASMAQSVQHITQDFSRVFWLTGRIEIDEASNAAHRW